MTTAGSSAARARYASEAVTTASPARLLLMLYDRLVRDLVTAQAALTGGELARASAELLHAQQIVLELRASLDLEGWTGAAGLADLYAFLHRELIAANVAKDPDRVVACREIVEPLRDAWRSAALQTVQSPA